MYQQLFLQNYVKYSLHKPFLRQSFQITKHVFLQVLYHSWMHAQRGRSLMVKTPMRIMFNAMCAECVAEKQMEKVGKLQDERTLRINSRRILSYNCSQFGCS